MEERRPPLGALIAASATFTLLFCAVPLTSPVLVPAGAIVGATILAAKSRGRLYPTVVRPSPVLVGLLVSGAYLLANATWSLAPSVAYTTVLVYFVLVLSVHVLSTALELDRFGVARANALGTCLGLAIGSLFLLVEVLTDQMLTRSVMSYVPAMTERRSQVKDGWVTQIPAYHSNRTALAITLCLWPSLLMAAKLDLGEWTRSILYVAFGAGLVAIAASEHETSKLACLGGALIFFLARASIAMARWATLVGWIVATMAVVPLSTALYSHQLHSMAWLPYSARDRVVIWGYTAEQVSRSPALGVGIGSSRILRGAAGGEVIPAVEPGQVHRRTTSYHSHNAYLQVWFEGGAVGAGLLLGVGLLLLACIRAAPSGAEAYLHAAFTSAALVAATSFSIWAPWFMASLALVPVLALVGLRVPKDGRKLQVSR